MASLKGKRSALSRYTDAGYRIEKAEKKLYVRTGRDDLRDIRQVDRSWQGEEVPFFETESMREEKRKATRTKKRVRQEKQLTFGQWIAAEAKSDRLFVIVSIVLIAVLLSFGALDARHLVDRVRVQQTINTYKTMTTQMEKDNERLTRLIEEMKDGSRIRNKAQNDLKMLRPERAENETIMIQVPEQVRIVQESEQQRSFGALDFLLGLLNVWHIGE